MTPPYEVRCYACNVSFPPDTKRCMHCGSRTGPPPLTPDSIDMSALGAPDSASAQPQSSAEPVAEEEAESPPQGVMRFARVAVWAVLALGAVVSRACNGG